MGVHLLWQGQAELVARVRNGKIYSGKIRGHLFGAWWWRRGLSNDGRIARHEKFGVVARFGPAGHLQVSSFTHDLGDGRLLRRTLVFSWWGVRGRRQKRWVEVGWGMKKKEKH